MSEVHAYGTYIPVGLQVQSLWSRLHPPLHCGELTVVHEASHGIRVPEQVAGWAVVHSQLSKSGIDPEGQVGVVH